MEYTNKLRALRAGNGLIQKEIAKLLSISANSYCSKEIGNKQFTQREIDILLSVFKVKYEDIFLPIESTNISLI